MQSATLRNEQSDLTKMAKLKQDLRRAKESPYYPISRSSLTPVPPDMLRNLQFVTAATGIFPPSYEHFSGTKNRRRFIAALLGILTSVVAGINLFKAISSEMGPIMPQQRTVFQKLTTALEDLEKDMQNLNGPDVLPEATALTILGIVTALRAGAWLKFLSFLCMPILFLSNRMSHVPRRVQHCPSVCKAILKGLTKVSFPICHRRRSPHG